MKKFFLSGVICLFFTIFGFSKNPYVAIREAIDKNDSISVRKIFLKTPDTKDAGLEHAIDKENITMINFLIKNNIQLDDGLFYAAKMNKSNICKIFLEKKANPNFLCIDKEQFYFDSIFVMRDKIPKEVKYVMNEKGEYWVPRKYFSAEVEDINTLPWRNKEGTVHNQGTFDSLKLDMYLAMEKRIIKYKPKRTGTTAMYYAIEKQNIELISLLSQYGYDFSKPYIVKQMKDNCPQWEHSNMPTPDYLKFAVSGGSHYRTNWFEIDDHIIYATVPPTPAIFCMPLYHAISINANKDIIDLIRENTK